MKSIYNLHIRKAALGAKASALIPDDSNPTKKDLEDIIEALDKMVQNPQARASLPTIPENHKGDMPK